MPYLEPPKALDWACSPNADLSALLAQIFVEASSEPMDDRKGVSWKWRITKVQRELVYQRSFSDRQPLDLSVAGPAQDAEQVASQVVADCYGALPWVVGRLRLDEDADAKLASRWLLAVVLTRHAVDLPHAARRPLTPLYERQLFLLLSAPFRPEFRRFGSAVCELFGNNRSMLHLLASDARRARERWAARLDVVGETQLFELLTPGEIDDEIDRVALAAPRRRALLELQVESLPCDSSGSRNGNGESEKSRAGAHQAGFIAWYVRRLLLPRFRLNDAYRVSRQAVRSERSWLAQFAAPLSVAALCGLIVWSVAGVLLPIESPVSVMDDQESSVWRWLVIALAASPYMIVVAGLARGGAAVAYPLALRLPAVAVLGTSVLLPLGTAWYSSTHWPVVVALVVFSAGYLLVEAANHRVSRSVLRAASVLVLGLAHGFAVSVLSFATAGGIFLAPIECASRPEDFALCSGRRDEWVQPQEVLFDPSLVAANLALSAALGVVLGLTLQVLWDDRPVTYPLTHLGSR